ncbi:unnamed protein product, partial [Rotaria sp. Silwood2]
HQVCSSYFISSEFIQLLWGDASALSYYWTSDLKILSTQFNLLSSLCSLAKNVIEQSIETFSFRELISVETLTHDSFQIQIDSILNNFINQAPIHFRRIHNYIADVFHANQLQNILDTNWKFALSTSKDYYIMSTSPISYNSSNSSCSCATMSTCSRSLFIHNNQSEILSGKIILCT